jgi:hypothetical protein
VQEVKLFYRDGDVGDGHRWEASVDVFDAAGATPGDALDELAAQVDAYHNPEPATVDEAKPVQVLAEAPVAAPAAPAPPAAEPDRSAAEFDAAIASLTPEQRALLADRLAASGTPTAAPGTQV